MTGTLQHGFKTTAEQTSLAIRKELGLGSGECLDCVRLASHLGVPVLPLEALGEDGASAESIAVLTQDGARFSALTICAGSRRLIIYNSHHPPGRCANSLAHELSHILLEHPPQPAIGVGGCRHWDAQLENEADWQAGALLVPREGALRWLRRGSSIEDGALHYGVSLSLFRWRVNQTGITRQLDAAQRLWHGKGVVPAS